MKNFRQAVMAVFVNKNGEILIGSSPRDGGYKIPQGGLDPGESPRDGVKREMFEELGIRLNDEQIIPLNNKRIHYYYPANEPLRSNYIGQEFSVFKIQYQDDMKPEPQDDEFDRLIWILPSDLDKYESHHRNQAYREALRLCGLIE